jgi:hypothetical protein
MKFISGSNRAYFISQYGRVFMAYEFLKPYKVPECFVDGKIAVEITTPGGIVMKEKIIVLMQSHWPEILIEK